VSDAVQPLLRVRDLVVTFGHGPSKVSAVAGVSFDVFEGETLGLVGESGCGKSTTAKALMRIIEPTSGVVQLEGADVTTLRGGALRRARTRMQMIFQDPSARSTRAGGSRTSSPSRSTAGRASTRRRTRRAGGRPLEQGRASTRPCTAIASPASSRAASASASPSPGRSRCGPGC
jgi:ABC-type oligopeptide transport system ATPase subunit